MLIGRNEQRLRETQETLECNSSVHATSVTDETALAEVAAATGTWDVMILAAGYLAKPTSIRESSVDEWWQSFEVRPNPV